MDATPTASPAPDAVRAEADEWLRAHWDPALTLLEWRRRLLSDGWAVPHWPQRWGGRALPPWSEQVVAEALTAIGAPGLPLGGGTGLAAPTILEQGPDELRARLLPPIVTGEETWCQLFSEPGNGSDLAGVTTHAVLDGDRWIVNGQKVWNTSAHHADFGMLVARTDWDVPKHRGLTYFALPMHQPGVEVRPLRQMNGHASFNEVFLTDAEIPRHFVVGTVGSGWAAALTTLGHERRFGSLARPRLHGAGRAIDEARREADEHFRTYSWYPQRAGRADLVVDHARAAGRAADPLVRDAVAATHALAQASRWTAQRALAGRAAGRPPGAEGSIGKLALSGLARRSARTHTIAAGAHGMLAESDAPHARTIAEILVSVPAQSIAGGTDEIQHNILGERVLGLPREPSVDADIAFRDVPRNR